ncbi:N-6 DNA methylase [Simplicispira lacusdiani]|uniref:N-6 DNA methylase n=1 Tax=Simplicispira lacusdiani TaxID=2213010 RepID=UPI0018E55797|nr:N-6 DNA methylase [Simplicispira lacusdiani]
MSVTSPSDASQLGLSLGSATSMNQNLPEVFKRIYYHLYSNSKASRAEAIIEDLSLLLLTKLSADQTGRRAVIESFVADGGDANTNLLPLLTSVFPKLLGTGQRFALDDASLRRSLSEMADLDLAKAPAHLIGEAFQALIGPRLRGEKGQFFTPKSLVQGMVQILDPKPWERVLDPCVGTGGFLAETFLYQAHKHGKEAANGGLIGVDKDSGLARLSSALLTVLAGQRAEIHNFNSLDFEEWRASTGSNPSDGFDVVLTNPPFGAKIGIKEPSILSNYSFGHVWSQSKTSGWTATGALCASEDPQVLFLEFCIRVLRPGGRLGIVLPEGMFGNKQTAYVWTWLRQQGSIDALLDCPRTAFQPGTDTKTNVLFFRKSELPGSPTKQKTKVAVAINCGHDRRGRSVKATGEAHADDFPHIATAYSNDGSDLWRNVDLNESEYLVPRYHYYKSDKGAPEEWLGSNAKLVTLGDLVKKGLISVRKGHEVGSDAYGTGEIPFIRTSDISNFEVSADPTKSVSEQVYEQYASAQNLQPGDILMVVDGRYRIGTTAILDEHSALCIAQSHLRIISVNDKSKLDPYSLLFALNLPSVKLRLRGLVFIQSTLGTLGSRLMELKIPLLIGEGPWRERIAQFRATLQGRSKLLSEMKRMAGPDIEL